jgi:twitching motility protein PilU
MAADPLEITASDTQPSLNTKPLFKLMVDRKASDLFFTSNAPIKIKIEGHIYPINKQVLSPAAVRTICFGLMNPDQIVYFQREFEIDFAISEPGLGRFRVNIFMQRGYPAMVLRYITADMPRLDSLGLPETLTDLAMAKRGLVLLVGSTGSGKSTTLAAMINATSPLRITWSRSRIRSSFCTATSARSSISAKWGWTPRATSGRCAV